MRAAPYILPSLYMVFVLVLSVATPPKEIPEVSYIDKVFHLAFYSVMGLLLARAFRREGIKRVVLWGFAVSFVYGALIEALQGFLPGRNAEILDAAANGAGSFLGALLYARLRRSV